MASLLSVYMLTFNSERRLLQAIVSAKQVADEFVVIDSGSTDSTLDILASHGVKILHKKFENFRDQRIFAEENCQNSWILALDSDEILSEKLVKEITELKVRDFYFNSLSPDGYAILRDWYFLGKKVKNFYPVRTPEYTVRLFRKERISSIGCKIVHENLQVEGCRIATINAPIEHYSCDSIDGLYSKINLYTSLLAEDMNYSGEPSTWIKINVYPWLIWIRWFIVFGSWRDGYLGIILSRYVRITIYLKYLKLSLMNKSR